jgi:hypothetical protein
MATNLPASNTYNVKSFFDNLFQDQVTFPAAEIDATVGFFVKRGFDTNSASSTAIVLLNQARQDNVPVFSLLDKLKGLTDVQLSQVVVQVLNASRENTSLLGYRVEIVTNTFEARNILV